MFSLFVVATDVADELPVEIFDRDEDAASDDIPLNFGKPDLNLVKPRRVGGTRVGTIYSRLTWKAANAAIAYRVGTRQTLLQVLIDIEHPQSEWVLLRKS